MDRYRKQKTSRKKPTALDGFVSSSSVKGVTNRGIQGQTRRKVAAGGHPTFARAPSMAQKTTNRPQLGNFNQVDGLHTIGQGAVGFGSSKGSSAAAATAVGEVAMSGRQPIRDTKGKIKLGHKSKTLAKDKPRWRKRLKRGALAFTALVVLFGSYFGIKAYLQSRKILAGGGGAVALQDDVDPSLLKVEGDGRVNVLLLGKGGEGHTAPDLTDTILVASIDLVNKEAGLVSIPRDTYVKTPTSGSMKINAVYATAKSKVLNGKKIDDQQHKAEQAGLDAIEQMAEDVLGIPVHYRAMVDFAGFKQAVDAVGGVELQVTKPLYEVMRLDGKSYTLNVKVGTEKFDGFRALAYARSRYTSSRGDFDRAERQRALLVALKGKALSLGTLGNPVKVNELLNALGNHVATNFTLDEIMKLYEKSKDIDSNKVESIGLADPPNNFLITGNVGGQSVVVPKAGLNNYKDIHNFIRNKLRDGYLKKEDAKIVVLNGTSISGLATKTSEHLKSFGYTITDSSDAPTKDYTNTIIVDLRDGENKYTQHYLEQRFKTSVTGKLPDGIIPGEADFVIIVGTNEKARLGL